MYKTTDHPIRIRAAAMFGTAALAGVMLLPTMSHAQMAGGFFDDTAGFYAGAGIGRADLDNPCPGSTNLVDCDDNGTAWKVYGGWQMNRWLSAELGYVNLPDADFNGQTGGGAGLNGDIDTWGITAHAVGKIPIPIGALDRISVLGKAGVVYWDRERNANLSAYDDDDSGVDFAWGVGAEYTISDRIGIRGEWERFENVGDSDVGEGDVDLWTVSVNYKF